jgi:DNA mismatch repair protein MutS
MSETATSIYDEYFALHRQYTAEYGKENTIVLMQVGVFYEMYGLRNVETGHDEKEPGITEFGRICELAVVPKSKVFYNDRKHNILMCGFKDDLADKYVRKMQNAGYTTVLYNQSPTAGKGVKREPRELFAIISPGTYCGSCGDDVLTNKTEISSNTVCCLWFYLRDMQSSLIKAANGSHKIHVGMSCVDIYTGNTVLYEFSRTYYPKLNNPNLFDPLDRFLSIHRPVELIMLTDGLDAAKVKRILGSVNVMQKVKKIHQIDLSSMSDDVGKETEIENKTVTRAKNCEKQIYQREVLARFYPQLTNNDMYQHKFDEHVFATQSFCYLLDFIHQHNAALTRQIHLPTFDNVGSHLLLENSSLIQLNILDDGKQLNARYASVTKMCCDSALTPMGSRKIAEMMLHPTTDAAYLRQEYAVVSAALPLINQNQQTFDKMAGIRDISQYLRLIYWKRITPKQLYFLYDSIEKVKDIYAVFSKEPAMHEYFQKTLDDYSHLLVDASKITNFLDSVLNIDKCKTVSGNVSSVGNELYILKRTANQELNRSMSMLYDSRDQLECCRTYFESMLTSANASTNLKGKKEKEAAENEEEEETGEEDSDFGSNKDRMVKINCTQTNNYTISSTELRCESISTQIDALSKIQDYVSIPYVSSTTGQTCEFKLKIGKEEVFTSKKKDVIKKYKPVIEFAKTSARSQNRYIKSTQLDECAHMLSTAKRNIAETIRRAYAEVLTQLEQFDAQMVAIVQYVASLDSVLARARMAQKNGYCCPTLVEESGTDASFVDAKNLRHCIIEKILTDEIYVANDVSLSSRGILLYGVNAVGKTSLIRSLGIAVIMAQAGFFVAASQFRFKPYTKLFTRIIGNDSLAKGLSTFVVEMLELNPILQNADQNSIVLGDELCSGTETPSAISLNSASLMRLCGRNVSFILATHYHELATLEEIESLPNLDIKHMAMFYDRGKDRLVYDRKLKDGIGSNRYGLEVCKALKMPEDFLDLANELRLKYFATAGAGSILDQKTSAYNSAHIRGMCQSCGKTMATEVHHSLPQHLADENGLITDAATGSVIHKNHAANLVSVCEKCHQAFHR